MYCQYIPNKTGGHHVEQNGKLVTQPMGRAYFRSMAGIRGTNGDLLKSLMSSVSPDVTPKLVR